MIIIGQDLCENHTDGMTSHVTGTSWLKSMMSQHVQICDVPLKPCCGPGEVGGPADGADEPRVRFERFRF